VLFSTTVNHLVCKSTVFYIIKMTIKKYKGLEDVFQSKCFYCPNTLSGMILNPNVLNILKKGLYRTNLELDWFFEDS